MNRLLAVLALTAALSGTTAPAQDSVDPTLEAQLRETLTAEGYEIRSVQMEDGKIEVYALKDGDRYEMYFDQDLTLLSGGEEDGEDNG